MEKWKKIDNTNDYYISCLGRIKSIKFGKEIILKTSLNHKRYNYVQIGLWINKKKKTFTVHRLVAEHFLRKEKYKNSVNHIDGNKFNNTVNNLEWCTPLENTRHGIRLGLIKLGGENSPNAKLTLKDIQFIRSSNLNQYKLAKKFNVSQPNISLIKRNINWKI